MSTTYHFVKVAAGEPFPFETGKYPYNWTGILDSDTIMAQWDKGEIIKHDAFVLRPVEPAADGGREWFYLDADNNKKEPTGEHCYRCKKVFKYGERRIPIVFHQSHPWYRKATIDEPREGSLGRCCYDITQKLGPAGVEPAPVDNVALLEWVGERFNFFMINKSWTERYVSHKVYSTAALIQEFINQQTKEV
jgi:hypothetical protein